MKRLLMAAASCCLLATPALANHAPKCKGDWLKLHAAFDHATGYQITELTPAQVATATPRYNSIPPASDFHPDHIYVVQHGPSMMLILANGTCIVAASPATEHGMSALLAPDAPQAAPEATPDATPPSAPQDAAPKPDLPGLLHVRSFVFLHPNLRSF